MRELQPDIAGHIASLGTTNDPLDMCHSCQRALLYGAMLYAGTLKSEVDRIKAAIQNSDPVDGNKALDGAIYHADSLVGMLAEFVRADFVGCLPGATDLNEEDWGIAITSFFDARCATYVSEDGKVMFEPHESDDDKPDDEGDLEGVAA